MRATQGFQGMAQADNAVRLEAERLTAWQDLDDPQRNMVYAVVRDTLERLLDSPGWIPASVRLGSARLDLSFVVELDVDRQDAAAAAIQLDGELAAARDRLAKMLDDLRGAADGPPA